MISLPLPQGNIVRKLKGEKADKAAVDAAVKVRTKRYTADLIIP